MNRSKKKDAKAWDSILLAFNFSDNPSLNDIFKYCNRFQDDFILKKEEFKKILNKMVKRQKPVLTDEYTLTKEGKYQLNQLNIQYTRTIKILRNYDDKKQYAKKEIRKEQQKLRNHLIKTCEEKCEFCEKKKPYFLLEAAHIKPRCIMNKYEKDDFDNYSIFLCRECHKLFDKGYLCIFNNELLVSSKFNIIDYDLPNYPKNKHFNSKQLKYFHFHHNHIFVR